MRLRRLELVIIGVTLAFACFIGGFFTGRSWSAVNIVPVSVQSSDADRSETILQTNVTTSQPPPGNTADKGSNNNTLAPPSDIVQTTQDSVQPDVSNELAGSPRSGDGRININLASQSELTDLPGIGNVLASRIVDHRRQHGDFKRIEDIRNVSGIGEKRFEAIQDKITIG